MQELIKILILSKKFFYVNISTNNVGKKKLAKPNEEFKCWKLSTFHTLNVKVE